MPTSRRSHEARWTGRLVVFLRVMAVLSMAKGLYHWAIVCGFAGPADGFEYQPTPWQTATVFFAVIDLVAAVGLWLAAAWGAVVWLTACVSMAAVEVFFPQVYGGRLIVVGDRGRAAVRLSVPGHPVGARASELRFESRGRLP